MRSRRSYKTYAVCAWAKIDHINCRHRVARVSGGRDKPDVTIWGSERAHSSGALDAEHDADSKANCHRQPNGYPNTQRYSHGSPYDNANTQRHTNYHAHAEPGAHARLDGAAQYGLCADLDVSLCTHR
jgi:hypothetical protein